MTLHTDKELFKELIDVNQDYDLIKIIREIYT